MAHSQKSIRDHARNRTHPNVDNKAISQQLEDLVKPCVYQQLAYYRCLGMRARILSLPLMLAAVLTLVWRQVPSVRELNRMLARENLLWAKATLVSQQALSQRLLTFPAELFEKVLRELLITLNQRWSQRKKRPLPLTVAYANQHFERLWMVDASTLEALFRKLKSLETSALGKLGGRICAVVDLKTRYPVQTWFNEKPYAHESNFVPNLLELVTPKTLLLLDRVGLNYCLFEQLILAGSGFITRLDLCDEIADELTLPTNSISVEMVFRGIYHFTQAFNQGSAINIIAYLTAPENRDLGIVKSLRSKRTKPPLDLSPSPS